MQNLYHCTGCKKKLPAGSFHKNSARPSGLATCCKECCRSTRRYFRRLRPDEPPRFCTCGKQLRTEAPECNACALVRGRMKKVEVERQAAELRQEQGKQCTQCKEFFPLSEFPRCSTRLDGHDSACRTCSRFSYYRTNARRRGASRPEAFVWTLTRQEFGDLVTQPCAYCDAPAAGGIDRVDNDCGYIPGNILPCCSICNQMKLDMPLSAWLAHMRSILDRLST